MAGSGRAFFFLPTEFPPPPRVAGSLSLFFSFFIDGNGQRLGSLFSHNDMIRRCRFFLPFPWKTLSSFRGTDRRPHVFFPRGSHRPAFWGWRARRPLPPCPFSSFLSLVNGFLFCRWRAAAVEGSSFLLRPFPFFGRALFYLCRSAAPGGSRGPFFTVLFDGIPSPFYRRRARARLPFSQHLIPLSHQRGETLVRFPFFSPFFVQLHSRAFATDVCSPLSRGTMISFFLWLFSLLL